MSNTNNVSTVRYHLRAAIIALITADMADSVVSVEFLNKEAERNMHAAENHADEWPEGQFESFFESVHDTLESNEIFDTPKTPEKFWEVWGNINWYVEKVKNQEAARVARGANLL